MVAQVISPSNPQNDAVDTLVSESIDGLSDGVLGGDLVDIRRQIDRFVHEKRWQVCTDEQGVAVVTPPP